jgi:hypothetical protein
MFFSEAAASCYIEKWRIAVQISVPILLLCSDFPKNASVDKLANKILQKYTRVLLSWMKLFCKLLVNNACLRFTSEATNQNARKPFIKYMYITRALIGRNLCLDQAIQTRKFKVPSRLQTCLPLLSIFYKTITSSSPRVWMTWSKHVGMLRGLRKSPNVSNIPKC